MSLLLYFRTKMKENIAKEGKKERKRKKPIPKGQ